MFLDWLSVHFLVDWFVSCLRVQRYGKEMIQPKLYHDFFKKFFRVALKALKINEKQYKKNSTCRAAQRLQGYRATVLQGYRWRTYARTCVRVCAYVCVRVCIVPDGTGGKRKEGFKFPYCTFLLCLCNLRGYCKLYRLLFGR